MPKPPAALVLTVFLLAGCAGSAPGPAATPNFRPVEGATVALPTAAPPTKVAPTNTLVMARAWTPTPIPTATPLPGESLGLVIGVLTPQTVEIALPGDRLHQTYVVRLLGVDAPPNTPVEPWGVVAFDTLNRWLTGRVVRVVQDVSVTDDAGQLPRYLYLQESLVNLKLVELGLARARFTPPDVTLNAEFAAAEATARAAGIGLWGPDPTATPSRTPTPNLTATARATPFITPTPTITLTPTITPTGGRP
ncbi:MAG: thermonuclease family protein [Anaerolineae bacterium]